MTKTSDYTLLREEVIWLKKYAKETNDYTVQLNGRLRLLEEQRLQEKLINLGKVVSSLSNSVDGVGEQLAMVRLERNELEARVEKLENNLGHGDRLERIETDIDGLEGNFDELSARVETCVNNITSFEGNFDELLKEHIQSNDSQPKPKRYGWVWVYPDETVSNVFPSREMAWDHNVCVGALTKIEWEE